MAVSNTEVRRILVFGLILLLIVLSFMILRPILLSIVLGLILAYAFLPIYKFSFRILREKNTAALAVCVLAVLIIVIPLWFVIPILIQQVFDAFNYTQSLDIIGFVQKIFPNSTVQFQRELASITSSFIGNISSTIINSLINFLLNLPTVLLHLAVIIFVFYFTLRDHEKLKEFVSGISPLKKDKERLLISKFKDTTSSIVFGYVLIGIIQGLFTGLGLLIFGVPRALLLTIFAIFAAILPMVGPWLIWIPAAIYLLSIGNTGAAIGFAIYSLVIVSTIDNILRPYIVARKTGTSSVIVLVGMIGGLLVFGLMGIILGPLILAYLLMFLKAYKEKTIADLFNAD